MKDLKGSSLWFNRVLTDSKNLYFKIGNYIVKITIISSCIKNYKKEPSCPFDLNFGLGSVAGVKPAWFFKNLFKKNKLKTLLYLEYPVKVDCCNLTVLKK